MTSLVWGHYLFKKTDLLTDPQAEQENSVESEQTKKLFCHVCKHHITDLDQAISINNSHTHTFTNPAGYTYTINCFRSATGCLTVGDPTNEFTWFGGYEWQIALCQSCKEQLGWLFTNDNEFYALINDRLTHVP
ncbi:MAG: cereblon family protein [Proteobacteria bacterium]|nr:cereblon family protein [Pseudomonadota bacterium]